MKTHKIKTRRIIPLAVTIAALLNSVTPAHSAAYFWDGATNGLWNTNTNWSADILPTSADDLTILGPLNVAGALTIEFNVNNSANSLNFTNTAATNILNTTTGSAKTLSIGSGGITTGSGAVQIGALSATNTVPVTLLANQTWNIGAGGLTTTNFIGGTSRSLTKTGAGILTFNTGATNGFSGGLNVNGGTVALDFVNMTTPTNLMNASNPLSLGSGVLTMTGKNVATNSSQNFNGTTLGFGRNTINLTKGGAATSATLDLGALTINLGSITMINTGTVWAASATPVAEIIKVSSISGFTLPTLTGPTNAINVNAGFFYRTTATTSTSGARWVNVDSTGQLQGNVGLPAQPVSGSAPTTAYQISNGTGNITLIGNAESFGLATNATVSGTPRTLSLGSFTYTINGILGIGSQPSTISATSGRLIIGSAKNLVINNDHTGSITVSAPIDNNGSIAGVGGTASDVTVTSTIASGTHGAITLSGANTYTGFTYISSATLTLGANNVLPSTTVVTMGLGIDSSTLNLNAFSQSVAGIQLGSTVTGGTHTITSASAATLSVGSASDYSFGGQITGAGLALSKTGAGTQTLSGANTYGGGTSITQGKLIAQTSVTALGSAAVSIANNATLQLNNNGAADFDLNTTNAITGAGTLEISATDAPQTSDRNRVRVGNLSGFTGNISVLSNGMFGNFTDGNTTNQNLTIASGGFMAIGNTGTFNSGFGKLDGGGKIIRNAGTTSTATLTLGNNNATGGNFSGSIEGSTTANSSGTFGSSGITAVTKVGSGTQTLSGTNTYSGATTVSAGTLLINGSLSGSSAVSVGAAGTLGGSGTIGGATTVANGGKLSPGASSGTVGTLNFGGNLNISAVDTPNSFEFQLGSVGPGNSDIVDLTSVSGILNIGSGIGFSDFAFSDVSGFGVGTYTLFETDNTIVGSLDAADLAGTIAGMPVSLGLGDGTDIVLTVVPEPSSVALLGLGAIGLMRRRRRSQHFPVE